MVNPVNHHHLNQATHERTGHTQGGASATREGGGQTPSPGPQAAAEAPSIDSARQLFELEANRMVETTPAIATPEQARGLLDHILQQAADVPGRLLQAQAGRSDGGLLHFLEKAPA